MAPSESFDFSYCKKYIIAARAEHSDVFEIYGPRWATKIRHPMSLTFRETNDSRTYVALRDVVMARTEALE